LFHKHPIPKKKKKKQRKSKDAYGIVPNTNKMNHKQVLSHKVKLPKVGSNAIVSLSLVRARAQ
jgi:hypothetical protein